VNGDLECGCPIVYVGGRRIDDLPANTALPQLATESVGTPWREPASLFDPGCRECFVVEESRCAETLQFGGNHVGSEPTLQ
jgi:hypothetical protein